MFTSVLKKNQQQKQKNSQTEGGKKKHPILSGIVGGVLFAILQLIIDYILMGGQPSIQRIIVGGAVFGVFLAVVVSKI